MIVPIERTLWSQLPLCAAIENPDALFFGDSERAKAMAKAICADCPVIAESWS